ncbi:MAG: fatty acid desaturase [Myxococcota bacterium]
MAGTQRTFTRVDYGEPHLQRRVALLRQHPEIRNLFGFDRRTAYVTVGVVAAQLGIAGGLQWAADRGSVIGAWWVISLTAVFVGAVLSHWLSMSIHECSHNLSAKRASTNRAISMLANVPLLLPCAMSFHRYHIAHHTYLGVDESDTDLARPFELGLIGTSSWRKFLVLLFFPALYIVRGFLFCKKPNRLEVLNAAIQVGVCVLLVSTMGWVAIGYLALSFWVGHSVHPVAAHFVHEHYIWEDGQETYSYYGPLNKVTFNVGYHYEHHDFMNVPGWRLPELRAMLAEHYDGLESQRSWTAILVRYVLDRTIGPHSRIVRSIAVFRHATKQSRLHGRNRHVIARP